MVLAIDVGNTRIKAAVYEQHTLVSKYVFDILTIDKNFKKILNDHQNIKTITISSVLNVNLDLLRDIFDGYKIDFITHKNHFPFINLYTTPETLGIDRMVLASGATLKFKNTNRLVIDAGTCVTFDYIDANDNYLGGAISPGIRLRYQSLNNYTAKLPLLDTKYPNTIVGNSTEESMHSGVVNGLLFEIDGTVNQFKSEKTNFIIILTGGDADFLAVRLKNPIFANSNFLLDSLNLLHIYNSNND
jgi:type III pantothenate kinase